MLGGRAAQPARPAMQPAAARGSLGGAHAGGLEFQAAGAPQKRPRQAASHLR